MGRKKRNSASKHIGGHMNTDTNNNVILILMGRMGDACLPEIWTFDADGNGRNEAGDTLKLPAWEPAYLWDRFPAWRAGPK